VCCVSVEVSVGVARMCVCVCVARVCNTSDICRLVELRSYTQPHFRNLVNVSI